MKQNKKIAILLIVLAVLSLCLVACAPTQLTAPTITLSGNVVSWNAVPFASSYDVYVGDQVVNVTNTSYAITTTQVGSYNITVVAKGDADNYLDSEKSNAVTYVVEQPAPTKLVAPAISLDGNVVSWNAVSNATGYDVYVNDVKVESNLTATSYQVTETDVGDYKIQVVAVGDGVSFTNSDKSAHQTYRITLTELDAPIIYASDNVISWSAVENATSYVVLVNNAQTTTVTECSYTLNSSNKGSYSIQVVATTTNPLFFESSLPSNTVAIVIAQLDQPVVTLDSQIANKITWASVTNATSYDVYVNDQLATTENSSNCEYYLPPMAQDNYQITVVAKSENPLLLDSEKSNAVTYAVTQLDCPTVQIVDNVASWDAVPNAVGYDVYVNDQLTTEGQSELSYNFAHILTVGDYKIQVVAVGNDYTYLDSDKSQVATYSVVKLATPQVTVTGKTASWSEVAGADEYQIYLYKGQTPPITPTSTQTSCSYQFNQSVAGDYNIQVVATSSKVYRHDSDISTVATYRLYQLTSPVIALDVDTKVISWSAVENATAYNVYMYDTQGSLDQTNDLLDTVAVEQDKSSYSYAITSQQEGVWAFCVIAVGNDVNYLNSAKSNTISMEIKAPAGPLATPVVTVTENVVSWTKVDNAVGYQVYLDGVLATDGAVGESISRYTIDTASFTQTQTFAVTVKAIASQNSDKFLDSEISLAVNYTVTKLDAPVIAFDQTIANKVVWEAVPNATGYMVYVNNVVQNQGVAITDTFFTVEITSATTYNVTVVAKGDSKLFINSELSNKIAHGVTQLSSPQNFVITQEGVASWSSVANAMGYIITVGDGNPIYTTETTYALPLESITAGVYDVSVVALGDEINYLTSEPSVYQNYQVVAIVDRITLQYASQFKTTYFLHEGYTQLVLDGLTFDVTYKNAQKKTDIAVEPDMLGDYSLATAEDNKKIDVTYYDAKAVLTINVKQANANDLTITGAPIIVNFDDGTTRATGYPSLTTLDGKSAITDGAINLPQGAHVLYTGENFVLVKVAHLVSTLDDFKNIANDMSGYYLLTKDIDFATQNETAVNWWSYDQIGLAPLTADKKIATGDVGEGGQVGVAFNGTFDGQGFAIKNFKQQIRDTEKPYDVVSYGCAIFGWLGESGKICDLTLDNVMIKGGGYTSLLVGYNQGVIENILVLENCHLCSTYSHASVISSYNQGTIKNVVSYLTTSNKVTNETEVLDENPLVIALGEGSVTNGYVGDTSNLQETLGASWKYFDGFGTYLVNDYFIRIKSTATTLPVGTTLNLQTLFSKDNGFAYNFYPASENWNDFVEIVFAEGIHTLQFKQGVDFSTLVGKTLEIVIINGGWNSSAKIVLTISAPIPVSYDEPSDLTITINQGEQIATSQIEITVHYSDGSTGTINPDSINFDSSQTEGTYTATYLYAGDKTGSFTVILNKAESAIITELVATASDVVLDYKTGESITDKILSQTTLKLAMSDNSQVDIDDMSKIAVSIGSRVSGIVPVTITYTDGAVVKTATVNYTIWYNVTTASDWAVMQSDLAGYYRLANDLDLSGVSIKPLAQPTIYQNDAGTTCNPTTEGSAIQNANVAKQFVGIFDGQGYSIKNVSMVGVHGWATYLDNFGYSLFGHIGVGGSVKNVVLDNVNIRSMNDNGFIATVNEGTVSNILVKDTCRIGGQWGIAGVVVYNHNGGSVEKVVSYANRIFDIAVDGTTAKTDSNGNEVVLQCVQNAESQPATCLVAGTDAFVAITSQETLDALFGAESGWTYVEGVGPTMGNASSQEGL